jgi:Protein of unknown function (DUF3017)
MNSSVPEPDSESPPGDLGSAAVAPRRDEDIPPVSAEDLVDGELPDPALAPVVEELDARRYPSTIGGACYLLILLATVVGLGIVLRGDWRVGVQTVGGSLVVAALLRLILPAKDAGMLAVRHRLLDFTMLAGVGGVIIFLAMTIPDQA